MMFFKKFFRKDPQYYIQQGEKCLRDGHFADARHYFTDALERINSDENVNVDEAALRNLLATANNELASLNLLEAERSVAAGASAKAEEYVKLAIELAEDVTIREKAEKLISKLEPATCSNDLNNNNISCFACKPAKEEAPQNSHPPDDELSFEDKFELLTHILPSPLPERYAGLGEKFAYAYMFIHDGNDDAALPLLSELMQKDDNDIVLYEMALIHYRAGNVIESEKLMRHALEVNKQNPLCYMGLVHLLLETEQIGEAIPLLQHMVDNGIMSDQAYLSLADAYVLAGEDMKAIDHLSKALSTAIARHAAERLAGLLARHGRTDEAAFITKRYLKGCC